MASNPGTAHAVLEHPSHSVEKEEDIKAVISFEDGVISFKDGDFKDGVISFKYGEVSRFGLAVRRKVGKRKDLGSIPLRLSFLFKKVVVCGHCLVTLTITSY